jgi:hypothetical protein
MAQKKQISQDMLAPILSRKAEMMDAVSRSKALQQPAPQLSVMEQVMAKNIEAENPANTVPKMPQQAPDQPQAIPQASEEAGVAQLPIPERQYAGGGIVAFAKGDLIDLDEEDDDNDILAEYAQAMAEGERAASMGAEMPAREMPTQNAGVGLRYTEPMPTGGSKGINYKGGKHPYENLVAAKAQEYGVDPMLASYILNKETGGMKNPENARSSAGAMGIAQFMPATAKQYGINPDIPEEAAIGMGKHLRYLMDKYENPKLAAIAYNWGEGNTNKWLKAGADMEKLPKETKKYVASLAGGGEVRHFASEGYVDPMGGYGGYYEERDTTFDPFQEALANSKKELQKRIQTEKNLKGTNLGVPSANAPAASKYPTEQEFKDFDQAAALFQAENMGKNIPAEQTSKAAVPKNELDTFLEEVAQGRKDLAEQRKEDKNMALLAAGLGMLGGSSQYAFENIGKGGLSGVQYLSEANKQRAAEKAALDKSQVTALRYKDLAEISKGGRESLLGLRQAELTERQRANSLNAVKAMRDDARSVAIAGLKQQGLLGEDLQNPNVAAKIEDAMQVILSRDPAFLQTYRDAFNVDYGRQIPQTNVSGDKRRYDSKGKEIK